MAVARDFTKIVEDVANKTEWKVLQGRGLSGARLNGKVAEIHRYHLPCVYPSRNGKMTEKYVSIVFEER